jgi:hypothetical protein
MNKRELINSLKATQLQSLRENRGLIHESTFKEIYDKAFQNQNIEKRKKELEAKQIEQTGKKIEYQPPTPSTDTDDQKATKSIVAKDVVSDLIDKYAPGTFRSDVEKYLESPAGFEKTKNYMGWNRPQSTTARLSADKLSELGTYYADQVKTGKMTGSEAAKQINSAAKQYQSREDEKFTQDLIKWGEESAWTGANIAGTALTFASGVGAPAAAARIATMAPKLGRLANLTNKTRKAVNAGGPLTGAAMDLTTAGTAKLNQALTDDPQEKQKYSDIASETGMRGLFTGGVIGAFKAAPLISKAVSPAIPKVVKKPIEKVGAVTGKAIEKAFSGNEPSQIGAGLYGYMKGSQIYGPIGGFIGGIGGTIVGGKVGQAASKAIPALNKNVKDIIRRK